MQYGHQTKQVESIILGGLLSVKNFNSTIRVKLNGFGRLAFRKVLKRVEIFLQNILLNRITKINAKYNMGSRNARML